MLVPAAILLSLLASPIQVNRTVVLADVFLADRGPYKFLVDTGAQTSLVDPALASELGLTPTYRVELVTQHGSSLVPGTRTNQMRIGARPIPESELIFHAMTQPQMLSSAVRGVLGMNVLSELDFLLEPKRGTIRIAAERPAGYVLPFRLVDGRMVVETHMGPETLHLALDSGASHIVLFHTPEAMRKTKPVASDLTTIEGARSTVPTTWTAPLTITREFQLRTQPAAIVNQPKGTVQGLLPASLFSQVFVDHVRHEVVLVP